jgi:hypothetical protein
MMEILGIKMERGVETTPIETTINECWDIHSETAQWD